MFNLREGSFEALVPADGVQPLVLVLDGSAAHPLVHVADRAHRHLHRVVLSSLGVQHGRVQLASNSR